MKAKELREKTNKELREMLEKLKEKVFELRVKISLRQQKNIKELKETKKDIAKILTILKEREK